MGNKKPQDLGEPPNELGDYEFVLPPMPEIPGDDTDDTK